MPFFNGEEGKSCGTEKGTPYGVGVYVDETGTAEEEYLLPGVGVYVDDRKEGPPTAIFAHCLATRSRQAPLSSLGVPFFSLKRP